jgi:phosphatidylethanolamine/phosphatidyl-N-methylethanolamine N-methyltransferase
MRADPLREDYLKFFETQYDAVNYNGRSLASRVLQHGHSLVEKGFGPEAYFDTVLEVGAGHGEHIDSVRHQYRRWIMTDINADELRRRWDTPEARARGIEVGAADAKNLAGYEDNSADRLLASHVLEHLPDPCSVLREWSRVVKPGGTISLVQPCDPGFAWRFGRSFGPRRDNHSAGNVDYDYWMAKEHVNSVQNLWTFMDYYFPNRKERWFPFGFKSYDLNLLFVVHLTNGKS